jgi:hypothetical protein
MKRILSVIALASLASISWAQSSLSVSGSGTFDPYVPTTAESAPNASWNFSFDVSSTPAVSNVYPGVSFDTSFSDFSYYLNGAPVTTTLTELTWFNAGEAGLIDLIFPDGGLGLFGSQAYSGLESAPTILTGVYPFSTGYVFDNLGNFGPLSGTLSIPEGSAPLLYLLLAGAACCGAIFLRPRNRFSSRETV